MGAGRTLKQAVSLVKPCIRDGGNDESSEAVNLPAVI